MQNEIELYEYAVYSLIITFVPLIIILVIGMIMGSMVESFIIILPFMIIRKYSGGYHAKYSWICLILSCGILFLCVYLINTIKYSIWDNLVLIISIICLIVFSPIDCENRRITNLEKKKYKKITIYLVLIFTCIYVIVLFMNKRFALCIMEGIVLSASLQIPCIFLELYTKLKH